MWETEPVPGDLQPGGVYEFRLPVSMGSKSSPPGTFLLKFNGKPVIDLGIALHDRAWHSGDGKIQASYLVMEDSAQESNGIMTFSVSASLLEPGKPATFEVVGQSPKSQSWFGIYQP